MGSPPTLRPDLTRIVHNKTIAPNQYYVITDSYCENLDINPAVKCMNVEERYHLDKADISFTCFLYIKLPG